MYSIIIVSMKFVDRITEQKRLFAALNADKESFVVVYGRRRLGKSLSKIGKRNGQTLWISLALVG